MPATILAVRAHDYAELLPPAPFHGLPREEIERLQGSLDVLAVPANAAHVDASYLQLYTLTALHYNYSWLSFGSAPRRLGVAQPLAGVAEPAPFLDAAYQPRALQGVEAQLALPECEWRLAGLLHGTPPGQAALVLVYVARLRRAHRAAALRDGTPVEWYGNGQLQLLRGEFDAWSRSLIDNLHAF